MVDLIVLVGFNLRFLLQEVCFEHNCAETFGVRVARIEYEWFHFQILIQRESCPFPLRKAEANGAPRNLRMRLYREDVVMARASGHLDMSVTNKNIVLDETVAPI